MSSLAFSLTFCTPRKQNTSNTSSSSCLHDIDSQPPIRNRIQTHLTSSGTQTRTALTLQTNENSISLLRREVLATGVSVGILGISILRPKLGEAEEGSSCEFTVSPSGLAYCDKVVGIGAQATAGLLIKAHYVGKLENGKVFDSSYGRGKPLTFRVGVGEVIKGWDQGILGTEGVPPMLAGGKRTLKIPPELAYGMRGAGCRGGTCIIPPDSTLFFDVEFVGKA